MKIRICSLILILGCLSITSFAQSNLHIPKEFKSAYERKTRSKDGMPGENYWQNTVDYDIEVIVEPETRTIDGKESVLYTNNSPDDLSIIVIRLYNDVFKTGNRRAESVNEKDIGEGVVITSLIVDGENYEIFNNELLERYGTNLVIRLKEPLKSGEQLSLDFEWNQKVPLTLRRTGAIDSTTFFVGYWYPQVSVYDDVFGWDRISYDLLIEFYNNLSNFNVRITAPDDYLVWATGTLDNSRDVLPSNIYNRYMDAKSSKELVKVVTKEDLKDFTLKSNTWKYSADEVTDFAFALSNHYLWDAISQDVSGRNVLINTAYPIDKEEECENITNIQQKTIKHFSEDIPGIPYPYPTFTTFIGLHGGGMEYPMMANNTGAGVELTIHEIFHTYFPMYVRTNEKRFAWMDEGWADFTTALVNHKYFEEDDDLATFFSNYRYTMQRTIGSIGDLPIMTPSFYLSGNYEYQSYGLPSFTYALLYQYFGEERFLDIFREYIRRWAKKSPIPYDFFYTFEDVSGEDLSWLWKPWYFNTGYPDVAIDSYKNGKLKIRNHGTRPVALFVNVEYKESDNSKTEPWSTIINSSVWNKNKDFYSVKIPDWKNVKYITVNSGLPDFYELDNFFPALEKRYAEINLSNDITGVFKIKEAPISAIITKKNGMLFIKITYTEVEGYLIPKAKNSYTTTGGKVLVNFKTLDNGETGINIEAYGFSLNGTKD